MRGRIPKLLWRHIKCNKAIRGTKNFNNMLLCAHGRSVSEASIDQALGLKSLDGEHVYIACVSGPLLDATVNQERTDFILSEDEKAAVRRGAIEQAKFFLANYVDAVVNQKKFTAETVINNNPQYMYLKNDLDEFVRGLSPATITREDILIEMARHRYRKAGHIHRMQEEIKEKKVWNDEVSQSVEQLTKLIDDDQKGVLAEYVLKRRSILEILDKIKQFEDPEKRRYPLEDAIHQLVCPMRIDSTKLTIEDHNLWDLYTCLTQPFENGRIVFSPSNGDGDRDHRNSTASFDLMDAFPDEQACVDHLRAIRWKNGEFCPHCGDGRKIYQLFRPQERSNAALAASGFRSRSVRSSRIRSSRSASGLWPFG